ncbi:MAG: HD domain-containing protein, partial [Christensenellales bacterium]|nr:HD domain-containing protein [Christensenellales bacterium]
LMIDILSHIVEFRNGESGLHIQHIHVAVELLLRQLVTRTDKYPLTEYDISLISTASALHDIGKINIPDSILNKPGKLTREEFEVMKTHTTIGASILKSFAFHQDEPLIRVAYDICRWHHERYDGGGYPDGLCGDEIPITAQVVALADVYDALTSKHCYKKAYSQEEAIRTILNGECGRFNPLLLDCLLAVKDQLYVKLHTTPAADASRTGAEQLSDRLLHEEELPYTSAMQYQLACERIKRDFYAKQTNSMVFDYDAAKGTVSISDYTAVPPYENQIADIDTLIRRRQISPDDQKKLKNAAALTTPDSPDASVTAAIYVDGKPVQHCIAIRTHSGRSISRVGSSVLSAMRIALTVRKRSSLN